MKCFLKRYGCRVSKLGVTKLTPFELVYGQEAVISLEISV
jgi:hypothetical protein